MSENDRPDGATAEAWTDVVIAGEDAEAFVQGQVTQDLATAREVARETLVLDPDGSLLTRAMLVFDADAWRLRVLSDVAERVAARLQRFRLRSRCAITLEPAPAPFVDAATRIAARWPGAAELEHSLSAHSMGSSVIEAAVSFTKGCYTGQELVARVDSRGATAPFSLVAMRGVSCDALDDLARSHGPESATGVTTCVRVDGGVLALAVVHRSAFADPGLVSALVGA